MNRSVTDTIAAAMEDADGADECYIVITTSDGDMVTHASTNRMSINIGLLETAKLRLAAQLVKDEESHP